jgi:hypothetical protein
MIDLPLYTIIFTLLFIYINKNKSNMKRKNPFTIIFEYGIIFSLPMYV